MSIADNRLWNDRLVKAQLELKLFDELPREQRDSDVGKSVRYGLVDAVNEYGTMCSA